MMTLVHLNLVVFQVLLALLNVTRASQHIFSAHDAFQDDKGLFTPIESLEYVKESGFTILRHPFFPKHSARIKKSKFCDGTVNTYTGYIDIEARHLFFYFFESRSDPGRDDVIFWTNGGPGGSSSFGLFMELGPCRIVETKSGPETEYFPESWNSNANIFFIDQPVGVGYSYAEYGESVSTTEEAAEDIAAFVAIFFENFIQFKGRPFHMAGESYGGRYIPLFASAVYDQNAALIEGGLTPVNLSSIMIGNGMTDPYGMVWSYYDFACSEVPVLSIGTCVHMKRIVERCKKWTKKACLDQYDEINCGAAAGWCTDQIMNPFLAAGINPYDYTQKLCDGGLEDSLCDPLIKQMDEYLSNPKLRKDLGVDSHPAIPANSSSLGWDVNAAFAASQDGLHVSTEYVAALLERGVRALIYVGTYDWICNWIGNERWTLDLEWSGGESFREENLREWVVDGKVAGKTRSFSGFTFATVDAAGHMVPAFKPKEALELVNRWMAGKSL
ncbi:hypothetical protein V5O48_009907 [Marasmius crinis-equi]|uniref:Carboxypeptidase n=1 Tax=Marasmius crinis-equi TaxID=585013 RepID=A0ABR3F9U5_9AGAR